MQSFEGYEIVSCPEKTDSFATSSEIVLKHVAISDRGLLRRAMHGRATAITVLTPTLFGVGIQDCPNGEGNKSSYENRDRDIVTLVVRA